MTALTGNYNHYYYLYTFLIFHLKGLATDHNFNYHLAMQYKIYIPFIFIFIFFITACGRGGFNSKDMALVQEIFEINGYDTKDINFVDSTIAYWDDKTYRLRALHIPNQFSIKKFPPSLSELDALETLDIGGRNIVVIGNEICTIPNLRSIEFRAPDLEQLPSEIGRLNTLVNFKIDKTKVTSLPESFSRLDKLATVVIVGEALTDLPEPIFTLKGLKKIEAELSKTEPVIINPRLGDIMTLESISLSGMILGLPKELHRLKNLKQLIVFGGENNESTPPFIFPAELYDLKKLEELQLYGCGLHDLPVGISKMESLKVLVLNSNYLKALPDDIYAMDRWVVNHTEEYYFSIYFNYICKVTPAQGVWLLKSDAYGRTSKSSWPVSQFCN